MPFLYLRLDVLFCYVFLLAAFLLVRKDGRIRAIRVMLISFLLWSIGEIGVWYEWLFNAAIWYNLAILGISLMPIALCQFLFMVADVPRNKYIMVSTLITVMAVVTNILFGWMLKVPERVIREDGALALNYELHFGFFVWAVFETMVFVYMIVWSFRCESKRRDNIRQCYPFIAGAVIVFMGMIYSMLSDHRFPYVAVLGFMYMLYMMYMVNKYRYVNVTRTILYTMVYGLVLVNIFVMVADMGNICQWFIERGFSISRAAPIISVIVVVFVLTLQMIASLVIRHVVTDWTEHKKQGIEDFQNMVSTTLKEEEIYDYVIATIKKVFSVSAARIRIRKPEQENYKIVRDEIFVDFKEEYTEEDESTDSLSNIEPIKRSFEDAITKTWDSENAVHIGEIAYDKETWGFIDLCTKKGVIFQTDDMDCFKQLCSYTANALKNARVYEKTYEDSITDDLTGLYSRKYAIQTIVEEFPKDGQASLVYMDLDDLKLYNELYGTYEGDKLIQWFAGILKSMCSKGRAYRYGFNEFLLHFPDTSVDEAFDIADAIRKCVEKVSRDKNSPVHAVTVSGGVAEYPDIARKCEKLIGYAQRGAFYGKKNGKNSVTVYSRHLEENEGKGKSYEQVAPTVYALTAAIDAKDSYTFVHSQKVAEYAAILGEEAGLHQEEIATLRQAGLLHDIGKIGIPESILKKRGRLTDEEYEIMKTHVVNSVKMIHYLPDMEYVIPAVVAHHERYDGKGYPERLKGDNIPFMGRILSIADCFDAMTARRPYKPPLSIEYATSEIERNAGTQFDPKLSQIFVKLIREGRVVVGSPNEEEGNAAG